MRSSCGIGDTQSGCAAVNVLQIAGLSQGELFSHAPRDGAETRVAPSLGRPLSRPESWAGEARVMHRVSWDDRGDGS